MEEILFFENRDAFRKWLEVHYSQSESIWLTLIKNEKEVLTPEEALEEALCFGWIDSLICRIDEKRYKKKFSKRRPDSDWSEKNKKLVDKLIQGGKMTEWGFKAVETAKQNGKWDKVRVELGGDAVDRFMEVIKGYEKAHQNFLKMNHSTKRQFAGFFLDAKKEETKISRLEKIVMLLEQNKRLM